MYLEKHTCDLDVHRSISISEKVDANPKNKEIFYLMALFHGSKYLRMVESSQRDGA